MRRRLIFLVTIITILSLVSCMKAPFLQEGEPYPCFKARDCDYRNPKNPEKCIDDHKECRARERYEYCKKSTNRWERDTEQGCWDKLNSK